MKKSLFIFLFLSIFYNNVVSAADIADLKEARKEAGWKAIRNSIFAPTALLASMIGPKWVEYGGDKLYKMLVKIPPSQFFERQVARTLAASMIGVLVGGLGLTVYFVGEGFESLRDFQVYGALINIENSKQSK